MKNRVILTLLFLALTLSAQGSPVDFFKDFYCRYLDSYSIKQEMYPNFDLFYNLSLSKVQAVQKLIETAKTKEELNRGIFMLDDEYYDLLENLDFELSYVPHFNLPKRCKNCFTKRYKKFIKKYKKEKLKNIKKGLKSNLQ